MRSGSMSRSTGIASLKAELSAEGRTYDELTQALCGGASRLTPHNGAVPLDLARLLAAADTPGRRRLEPQQCHSVRPAQRRLSPR